MRYACSVESNSVDPVDGSHPGSSIHGILQARILEWVAIPFSRGIFPTQGSNLPLWRLLPGQADSLGTWEAIISDGKVKELTVA